MNTIFFILGSAGIAWFVYALISVGADGMRDPNRDRD